MRAALLLALVAMPFAVMGTDYTVADSQAANVIGPIGTQRSAAAADGFDYGAVCPSSNFAPLSVTSTCGQVMYGGFGCMLANSHLLHPGPVTSGGPDCDAAMKYTFPWAGTFTVQLPTYGRGNGNPGDGTANDGNTFSFALFGAGHNLKQTLVAQYHMPAGTSGSLAPVTINAAAGDYVVLRTGAHGDTTHDSFYFRFVAKSSCNVECSTPYCGQAFRTTCLGSPTTYELANYQADYLAGAEGQTRAQARNDGWQYAYYPSGVETALPFSATAISPGCEAGYHQSGCRIAQATYLHPGENQYVGAVYTLQQDASTLFMVLDLGSRDQGDGVVVRMYRNGVQISSNILHPSHRTATLQLATSGVTGDKFSVRVHQRSTISYDSMTIQMRFETPCSNSCSSQYCSTSFTTCPTHDPAVSAFCDDIQSKCSSMDTECTTLRSLNHIPVQSPNVLNPTNRHLYRLVTFSSGAQTFAQFRATAQAIGAGWDLATFSDIAELNFVKDNLVTPHYVSGTHAYTVGAYDSASGWKWIDGSSVAVSTFFGAGEPNGHSVPYPHAGMDNRYAFKFNDYVNDNYCVGGSTCYLSGFVAEKHTAEPDSEIPDDCDATVAACNDVEADCRAKAATCPLV